MMLKSLELLILFFSLLYTPVQCQRVTCSQQWFEGADTNDNKVWCGFGFHACVGHPGACCSNVYATPIQLAISIICPSAMILSIAMLAFVIYKAVSVVREDREIRAVSKNKVVPVYN